MWSPELETLDQLLGGDLRLKIIRSLFPSQDRFVAGISAMLHTGEVRLLAGSTEIPRWQWAEALSELDSQVTLAITELGVCRMQSGPGTQEINTTST